MKKEYGEVRRRVNENLRLSATQDNGSAAMRVHLPCPVPFFCLVFSPVFFFVLFADELCACTFLPGAFFFSFPFPFLFLTTLHLKP